MKYLFLLSLVIIAIFTFLPAQFTSAFIVDHDRAAHAITFFILFWMVPEPFKLCVEKKSR